MKTLLAGAILAGLAFATPTMANAAPYSTSGVPSALIAPSGDAIGLASGSGTLTAPGTYTLNAGTWDIGDSGQLTTTLTGSLSETLTVNGSTIVISVPYTLSVTPSQDTFTIDPGVTYTVDGATLTLLGAGPFPATSFGSIPFIVSADFTSVPAPEPMTLAILGTSLLGLGVARRRHA